MKFILVLEGYIDWVFDVEFSYCGKLIVIGGVDNIVRLWSCRGILLFILEVYMGWVMVVDFYKDGEFLVFVGVDDIVIIWNIKV